MDSQDPPPINPSTPSVPESSPASAPVTPAGTAYTPPPTTPPPPPLSETPTPPSSKDRWILIAGLVLVLLFIGAGGYLYSMNMQKPQPIIQEKVMIKPSPTIIPTATPIATDSATASPAANWKTYTSLDKTYTIQYPSDIFVRKICQGEELTLSPRREEKEESIVMPSCARDGMYNIEVITLKQPPIPPTSDEYYAITKKDITIAGAPAQEYTRTLIKEPLGPFITYSKDVYVSKDGTYYQLHLGSKTLEYTFEQILSTFKFTK